MIGENKAINRFFNSLISKCILVLLISCVVVFCFTGCSGTVKNYQKDSVVQYSLTIPETDTEKSMKFSFSLPLFKICSKEFIAADINEEYVVGDTAIIYGDNVEQLDGMSLYIIQDKLSNVVEDKASFYQELKEVYNWKNETDIKNKDVEESLKPYLDSCYLVSCNMCFDGHIDKNVKVESIEIPDLGYRFNLDEFRLNLCDINIKDIKLDDGQLIDYTSYNGCFVDSKMHNMGFFNLEGDALVDIDDIQLISLNGECKVTYSEAVDYTDQFKLSAKKGDSIEEQLYYRFENLSPDTDATVASLVLQTRKGSQTYWRLRYQPTYIDGKFLLASEIGAN